MNELQWREGETYADGSYDEPYDKRPYNVHLRVLIYQSSTDGKVAEGWWYRADVYYFRQYELMSKVVLEDYTPAGKEQAKEKALRDLVRCEKAAKALMEETLEGGTEAQAAGLVEVVSPL